jgi:hypothetical protein
VIFLRLKHVRARLTLSYVFLLAAILALSWGFVGLFVFFQLRSQLDRYAIQDIETVEGLLSFNLAGRLELREDYHNHEESKQALEWLLEVRSPDGEVLYRNERLGARSLGYLADRGRVTLPSRASTQRAHQSTGVRADREPTRHPECSCDPCAACAPGGHRAVR